MEKKDKGFESYEPPKLEVLEIMVEQAVLQASGLSGSAPDSDDSEFGLSDPRGLNW
jgi:hypothetical protein